MGQDHPEDNRKRPDVLGTLVVVTSVAWNVVVPIVGGALLGRYLDDRVGEEYLWTITLLFAGTFIAFYNLFQMLFRKR